MRVRVQKTVEVDTDVTVSSEEIMQALEENLATAKENPESPHIVNGFVNAVYQCLLAMDDGFVNRMNPKHRQTIAEALEKVAIRFRDSVTA